MAENTSPDYFQTFPNEATKWPGDSVYVQVPDGEEALHYTVGHPFVTKVCGGCNDAICYCSEFKYYWCSTVYECSLCDRTGMSQSTAEDHLTEPSHVERMAQATAERSKAIRIMDRWYCIHNMPQFKQLKRDSAIFLPDSVLAAAFRYIMADTDKDMAKVLRQFKNLDRLTLLDLAVWKAQCLSQMEGADSLAKDQNSFGWKMHKSANRMSGATKIIVSLVLPFL